LKKIVSFGKQTSRGEKGSNNGVNSGATKFRRKPTQDEAKGERDPSFNLPPKKEGTACSKGDKEAVPRTIV